MTWTIIFIKVVLIAVVLAAFSMTLVQGKAEYTKKEGAACTVCHTKTGTKELNEIGKCYEKTKSLKDCKGGDKKAK